MYTSDWMKMLIFSLQLQSLLQNSHVVLDVPSTTKEFCQFNPETKYSLDGKLGVQLMKALMDASLSASDSVTISSKLGAIDEKSLDSEALLEALKSRLLLGVLLLHLVFPLQLDLFE